MMPEASVLIVRSDPERVESDLASGLVACPCGGALRLGVCPLAGVAF